MTDVILLLLVALIAQQLDHLLHFLFGDIDPLTHLVTADFTDQQLLADFIAKLQFSQTILHGLLFELFRCHFAIGGNRGNGLIQLVVADAQALTISQLQYQALADEAIQCLLA